MNRDDEIEQLRAKQEQMEAYIHMAHQRDSAEIERLRAELDALRTEIRDGELGRYSRTDGHRDWWTGGVWLQPNDIVTIVNTAAVEGAVRHIDAARKHA